MTHLVELLEAMTKFEASGIKLYAVSYDDSDALADFATRVRQTLSCSADTTRS